MSTPDMIYRLTVEAFLPDYTQGGFVLNSSMLDNGKLGDSADSSYWWPISTNATEVQIRRGGDRDGLTVAAEVGTLTVTMVSDYPPNPALLKLGTPVRVTEHRALGDVRLFTGSMLDMRSDYERRDDLATTYAVTTITAVDAVQALANTQRDGAVLSHAYRWQDTELFGQRVRRYLSGGRWEYNAPTVDMLPNWGPVRSVGYGPAGYGGNAEFVRPSEEGPGLTAVYLTPGRTYTPGEWGFTMGTMDPIPGARPRISFWVRIVPGSHSVVPRKFTSRDRSVYDRQEYELEPYVWRLVTVHSYANPGSSVGPVNAFLISTAIDEPYTAPSSGTQHRLEFTGWSVALGLPTAPEFPQHSIVYESTLANHLDVATNSVHGAWWVDADGVVQVRAERDTGDTPVLLSDDGTGDYSYVGITAAFDTQGIANDISLQNHGRTIDETGRPVANDRTVGPFTDITSAATYGRRAGTVETSLHDAHPVYGNVAQRLAERYLEHTSRAESLPSQVRLFRDPRKPQAPVIDVMSPVDVKFRGATHEMAVVSIEHEIDPETWHTTLHLIER